MAAIRAGMEEWTSKTCIRFKKRTNERAYANFKLGSGYVYMASQVTKKNATKKPVETRVEDDCFGKLKPNTRVELPGPLTYSSTIAIDQNQGIFSS